MRRVVTIVAVGVCAALGMACVAGCATTSGNSASGSAAAVQSSGAGPSSIANLGGAALTKLEIIMVGDTPNFQPTFSNDSDSPIEFDLSKFKIVKEDGTEVDFSLGSKTLSANRPYVQFTFAASPGSLSAGDKVTVSYEDRNLGVYEVRGF